jgi:ribonuclease P protein component
MQEFKKSERLCNFRLRKMLFQEGESFFLYPFRVLYLELDPDLEPLFYPGESICYVGNKANDSSRTRQNSSWPLLKLPDNALFPRPAKCLLSVSAKHFKRAVDRNRLKRQMKESYRKNKSPFYSFLENKGKICLLAFIYAAKEKLPYHELAEKIPLSLRMIMQRSEKKNLTHPGNSLQKHNAEE